MPRESAIQGAILSALHLAFPASMFWRNNTGSGRSPDGARWISYGRLGSPDIIGCHDGRFVGVEVKTPVGKLRQSQLDFRAEFVRAGGLYIVARSIDEAIDGITAGTSTPLPETPKLIPAPSLPLIEATRRARVAQARRAVR